MGVLISSFAQKGQIAGTVTDAKSEEALIGVTILIEGTTNGATTDLNGKYLIKDLNPGSYNLTASYVGYESKTAYNVVVKTGGNPDVNFQLSEAVEELEGVTVTANPFEKSLETPLSIQKLSQEEVATYPGGNNDIAKVVQSLPGIENSFLVINL